jgi:molybdopterin biosynthesis enzyme
VGVLTAAGIGEIAVRMPRLRLVPARAGQDAMIAGALSLLQSAVANHGVTAERGEIFEETPTDADALIVVGGTGAGRNDAAVRTLAVRGRVELHGIALSPGETAAFGFIGETPVLLLPGRLDAAIAAWLTLGDRLMTIMTAKAADVPPKRVVLGRKHASPLGMAEVVPVGLQDGRASPIASNHWPLQAIVQTDGWFLVPPESEGFPAGAEIMIKPWL